MQHKRISSVKNLIMIHMIAVSALLSVSCGRAAQEPVTVPSANAVSEDSVKVSDLEVNDLAVFMGYKPETADISLMSADNGRTYSVSVNDLSRFADRYGKVTVPELFEPGMIVEADISVHSKSLKSLQQSPDAYVKRDVEDFDINLNRGVFRLKDGTNLHITPNTAVLKDGKRVKAEDISDSDTLILGGVDHELYSIVISSGYGHLKIKGTQYFSGGWVQIAGMIKPVGDDPGMMLDVAEGEYELVVTYKGRGGTKPVAINRGRETVIDVSDLKEDLVKTGELVFTIRPADALAKVKIDGEEVDYYSPVTLEYGVYMMEVSAEGYNTVKERISVGSDVSNVDIELQEKQSKNSEEKQDSGSGTTSSSTTTGAGTSGTGSTGTTSSSTTSTSSSAVSRNSADGSVLYGNHIYIDAPEKAEVYFDGIYKGIVPCSFTKESGTHVITLRRDGYETRTFTVTLDTTTQNETYSFSELQAK
ncbi:MAG TPA: hypothetical protein DIS68_03910 [Lachnospiraceae bacterium]|nr:hypothetical protein [Lachnospiraceae bacterium]HCR99938.1 hypothetical protein [Lachnospiraceae bacterium]